MCACVRLPLCLCLCFFGSVFGDLRDAEEALMHLHIVEHRVKTRVEPRIPHL